jgi:hypothetical protein
MALDSTEKEETREMSEQKPWFRQDYSVAAWRQQRVRLLS